MHKFETPQEQSQSTIEKIEQVKQALEPLLNNPEENKEEISKLVSELRILNNILEEKVAKETRKIVSFYEENIDKIESEFRPLLLEELSKNSSEDIRRYVAVNPNTSKETLQELFQDSSENIRFTIA
ncbi:MAG: HEAT repeat domain-containing protein [Candidatus Pacebacteria bacterium]|jgi:predicted  nucleic acid-binding Zn-ribbon protein|nr:HEAT repeat domain-containing protein [Candidatus Paceibacterota bacterium]MDD2796642.1 HEAT repeat domain-containing protein [Candidatus Paceibacterota bacterium]MDD3047879.1 HEAT repeat domain-containing protein [Candidatus Paceibacterota bacterium]MDD3509937.1 HEAT repeat domain-containing protein [Candidatus Paceibacterota bacterium]MDD3918546.1 HEAT repeat domain-containing protein [Candidatus Paceibacterota bacterium]